MMWDGWYGLTPDDRVLHAGAFNWTYTLGAGLTDPWAVGATALIYTGPRDRAVWPRLAAAHGATIFAAAPGVYRQMLDAPGLAAGFAGLRHGLSAGEALPDAGPPRLERARPASRSTRRSACRRSRPTSPSPRRARTVEGATGYPQPGRRVAVLADDGAEPVPRGTEGLLAVSRRDPGLMLGYWNRPEETAAAFRGEWFVTGDRAVMRADGAIVSRGRADDLLNAGGYRVSPAEIEAVLLAIPPSPRRPPSSSPSAPASRSSRPSTSPNGPPPAEADLAAHCAARLARYKCPRAFRAVAALPRDANGKLLRRRLKETAAP